MANYAIVYDVYMKNCYYYQLKIEQSFDEPQ